MQTQRKNFDTALKNIYGKKNSGFTLIELLVVIAIIGLLSAVILLSVQNARTKSRNTKSIADLRELRTAISLLEQDTGKWPNGCEIEQTGNPEIDLDQPDAGIKFKPETGSNGGNCQWTSSEVAGWNGPYAQITTDIWGISYHFDPDFYICEGGFSTKRAVVQSFGPNKQQNYPSSNNSEGAACINEDSDDIYILLK